MKIQTSNFKLQIISFIVGILVFGFGISAANAVTIPAKSVVNPLNSALYVIDNGAVADTARLIAYKKLDNMWSGDLTVGNKLLAGSKCYGLAVSADGLKLYVSIEKGKDSAVWIYSLDKFTGLPTTNITKIPGSGWATADSAPKGIAVDPDTGYIYVADAGLGKIHIFKNNAYSFSFGPGLSDAGLYDLAITGNKLFVSKKNTTGKIFYYALPIASSAAAPKFTLSTGLVTPTYLKVSPDSSRLYVAVNGASTEDIYIYTINAASLSNKKIISNKDNITGAFGWTGFDLAPDGKTLFYTQAQNQAETMTKLYKVTELPDSPVTAYVKDVAKSDGLAISSDQKYLAVTYSGNGQVNGGVLGSANGIETGLGYVTPVITSVSPDYANIDADGVTVTVYGNYFQLSGSSKPDLSLCTNPSTQIGAYGTYKLSDVTVKSPTEISGKLLQDTTNGISGIVNDKKLDGKPLNEKLHVRVINDPYIGNTAIAYLNSAFEIKDPAKAPAVESPLLQKADGKLLSAGENTNAKTMTFSFGMSDPNFASETYPVKLTPQVKVTNINDADNPSFFTGDLLNYNGNGAVFPAGIVNVSDLPEGSYTWQARVVDEGGLTSAWVSFPSKATHFIIDRIPPTVTSTDPKDGGATASLKPTIKVNFSERMDALPFLNYPDKSVIVKANGAVVACGLSYVDGHSHTLSITPNNDLPKEAKVEVQLVGKNAITYYTIKDEAGNVLDGDKNGTGGDDYVFKFTLDQTPPELDFNSVFPSVETTEAALDTKVVVAFNESMDQGSITASALYQEDSSKTLKTINLDLFKWLDGKSAEFSHALPFPANTEITIKVSHAKDLAGNLFVENSWIFYTAKKPVVSKIYPISAPENKETPTPIIIAGQNLTGEVSAKIFDVPLTNVKLIDSGHVSASVPAPNLAGLGMGKYHITVTAAGGTSDQTNADYFEITQAGLNPQGDPDQVADLQAQAVEDPAVPGTYKVNLKWTNPPDLDLQTVKLFRSATGFPKIKSDGSIDPINGPADTEEKFKSMPPEPGLIGTGTFEDQAVQAGNTYYYAVYAGDTSGKWNTAVAEGKNAVKVEVGSEVTKPNPPQNLTVTKQGNGVILKWDAPAVGTVPDNYYIYRYSGTDPAESNILLNKIDEDKELKKQFEDPSVLTGDKSYYYLVTAVKSGQESKPSNMGYSLKSAMTPNPIGINNKNWVSIPYKTNYQTLADVLEDVNDINDDITVAPGALQVPNKIDYIARLNAANQVVESMWYDEGMGQWNSSSDNSETLDKIEAPLFSVGEGFEVNIKEGSGPAIFAGAYDPNFQFELKYNSNGLDNKNWISLPYHKLNATLANVLEDINGITDVTQLPGVTTKPAKVDYIARFNAANQAVESMWYDEGMGQWNSSSDNGDTVDIVESPPAPLGEGFEITLKSDLSWKPQVQQ